MNWARFLKIIWSIRARPWSISYNSQENIRNIRIICRRAMRPRWLAGLDRTSLIVVYYFIHFYFFIFYFCKGRSIETSNNVQQLALVQLNKCHCIIICSCQIGSENYRFIGSVQFFGVLSFFCCQWRLSFYTENLAMGILLSVKWTSFITLSIN